MRGQWSALSHATNEEGERKPKRNIEVHPVHLKHLLDQMGVDRSEVDIIPTATAPRAHSAITDIFCLPEQSAGWRDLPAARKTMPHIQTGRSGR